MNKEKLQARFMRDPLPRRMGGLAATFGRIASSARESDNPLVVASLLQEAKYLIEWSAAEAEPETAEELVKIQTMIALWLRAWDKANENRQQRILLSVQAKDWADKALAFSGLL